MPRIRILRLLFLVATYLYSLLFVAVVVQSLPSSLQQSHSRLSSRPVLSRNWPLNSVNAATKLPEPVIRTSGADDANPAADVARIGTVSQASVNIVPVRGGQSESSSSTSPMRTPWSHNRIQQSMVLALMSMSGIIEAICWRQYKCFPNMMTGHTVKVLDALAGWMWEDALWGTTMIVSYFLGGTLYKIIQLLQQPQLQQLQPSKDNPSQTAVIPNTLMAVARWSMVWFCMSDLLEGRLGVAHSLWRLPLLSVGFGMINAATMDIWGAVTNAVTGHWTKMSTGLAEGLVLGSNGVGQASKMSAACMASFAISLMATSGLMQWLGRSATTGNIGSGLARVQSIILERLPPLGTTLGLIYGVLFTGYARYYRRYHQSKN